MSANVLGCGVHHDIRPHIQGLLVDRGTERIVYVYQRLVFPGYAGHGPYVLKGKQHRGRALQHNQVRSICHSLLKFLHPVAGHIRKGNVQVLRTVFAEEVL